MTFSLRRRGNLTGNSDVCEAALRFFILNPQRTQRITGSAFRMSLQPDWQTDKGPLSHGGHFVPRD